MFENHHSKNNLAAKTNTITSRLQLLETFMAPSSDIVPVNQGRVVGIVQGSAVKNASVTCGDSMAGGNAIGGSISHI